MTHSAPHYWKFFRAGGFDQVQIDTPEDLAALRGLDQKLWAALACPVKGLNFDARTLAYIDADNDGRIRAPELLAAVEWSLSVLATPQVLFAGDALPLSAFNDTDAGKNLSAAARRLLANIGRENATQLTVSDTSDMAKIFPPAMPNGDGLVPATMTENSELKAAIADIILCMGAETDRSNEPAISLEKTQEFFAQAETFVAWHQRSAREAALKPFGDNTATGIAALMAVQEKINDFFNRVQMAAFDPRAGAIMNGDESVLVQLAAQSLAACTNAAALPLAHISAGQDLPLSDGLNPAWSAALHTFRQHAVRPALGDLATLSAQSWQLLLEKCAAHLAWLNEKPVLAVSVLEPARLEWLVANSVQAKLLALIEQDCAVSAEAEGLLEVDKLVRFQKNLVCLLNNFVSLRDFYTRRDKAIFQAGTLFIDGKSADLTVQVNDLAKHGAMAAASGSYLVYCDCTRAGSAEKLTIVAAITAGDSGNLLLGRNGIFYDRNGADWDATVVKLIEHPISVREAFWTPYRRMGKMVSEQMQKMAASRDKAITDKSAANITGATTTAGTPAAPATPPTPPFDIAKFAGIFAAMGLAVGAIGTMLTGIASGFLSLPLWQMPLAIAGMLLLISGPSMVLAWFKLRKRNLGPLLDANGWAVNTRACINIGFGTALTQLATLPSNAERSLHDPHAPKKSVGLIILVAALIAAAVMWCARARGWV